MAADELDELIGLIAAKAAFGVGPVRLKHQFAHLAKGGRRRLSSTPSGQFYEEFDAVVLLDRVPRAIADEVYDVGTDRGERIGMNRLGEKNLSSGERFGKAPINPPAQSS